MIPPALSLACNFLTEPVPCSCRCPQAYQVFKARASGADAILLIAAVLPNSDMNYLIKSARSVGLQCLIEVGSREGLDAVAFPGQLARPVGALMRRRQSPRKLARSVMPTLAFRLQVHTVAELERMLRLESLDGCMLGINNRDLQVRLVCLLLLFGS